MSENWNAKIEDLPEPARSEAKRIAENIGGVAAFFSLPQAERISAIERVQKKLQQGGAAINLNLTFGSDIEKYLFSTLGKARDFTAVPAQLLYDTMVATQGALYERQADVSYITQNEAAEIAYKAGRILERVHHDQSVGVSGLAVTVRSYINAIWTFVTSYAKDLMNGTHETQPFTSYLEGARGEIEQRNKLESTRTKSIALREELQKQTYGEGSKIDAGLAQMIAGVDHRDDFVPTSSATRLPAFVDTGDHSLSEAVIKEQKEKNPTLVDSLKKPFANIDSKTDVAALAGGGIIATATVGTAVVAGKKTLSTAAKLVTVPARWGAAGVTWAGRATGLMAPAAPAVHSMAAAMSQSASAKPAMDVVAKGMSEAGHAAARATLRQAATGLLWRAGAVVTGPVGLGATAAYYSGVFDTGNIPTDAQERLSLALSEFLQIFPENKNTAEKIADPALKASALKIIELVELDERVDDLRAKIAEQDKKEGVTWRIFATEDGKKLAALEAQQQSAHAEFRQETLTNMQNNNMIGSDFRLVKNEAYTQLKEMFAEAQAKAAATEKSPVTPAKPDVSADKVSSVVAPLEPQALAAAHDGIIEQTRAAARSVADAGVVMKSSSPRPFARVSDVKLIGVTEVTEVPQGDAPKASAAPVVTGTQSATAVVASA